jgi:hypothetical protein
MDISFVNIDDLVIPEWKATYILKPELMVLARSIGMYGLMSPLVVQADTNIIIDGAARFSIISNTPQLREKFNNKIPVIFNDCDNLNSMILHVQMNRGRGFLVAHRLSMIIKWLRRAGRLKDRDYDDYFAMKFDELELLLDGSFIKHRATKEHNYSKAWVPVEAPAGTVDKTLISIEKPPNQDS